MTGTGVTPPRFYQPPFPFRQAMACSVGGLVCVYNRGVVILETYDRIKAEMARLEAGVSFLVAQLTAT